ncbi:MAG: beta-lactamase [Rhizobiales bacterium]|nr:beta-lactamase [Hyphomicrobiales bacterium]
MRTGAALLLSLLLAIPAHAEGRNLQLAEFVAGAVRPVMEQHGIPGMQVGLIAGGQTHTFEFGTASRKAGRPVTPDTLFESGSISKTFTVTLAAYAEITGRMSLSATVGTYIPELRDSPIGQVPLVDLATHTAGGFPLQIPEGVDLDAYFRSWTPAYKLGTMRTYANPSIGLLGLVTARALNGEYQELVEKHVFVPLGLKHTFLDVPKSEAGNYARGYTQTDAPVRLSAGLLAMETYGVRTTAGDLLRFIAANMGLRQPADDLDRAIMRTHTGYYRVGAMTQDLIWEQYADPVNLEDVIAMSLPRQALEPAPVHLMKPPEAPRPDVFINKTGSTRGFGAYVAFRPDKGLGVVLLANKFYPNEARVKLAWQLLEHLGR